LFNILKCGEKCFIQYLFISTKAALHIHYLKVSRNTNVAITSKLSFSFSNKEFSFFAVFQYRRD
jgi:hypothetical protein